MNWETTFEVTPAGRAAATTDRRPARRGYRLTRNGRRILLPLIQATAVFAELQQRREIERALDDWLCEECHTEPKSPHCPYCTGCAASVLDEAIGSREAGHGPAGGYYA